MATQSPPSTKIVITEQTQSNEVLSTSVAPLPTPDKIVTFTSVNGVWSLNVTLFDLTRPFTQRDLNMLIRTLQVKTVEIKRKFQIEYSKRVRDEAERLKKLEEEKAKLTATTDKI